MKRPNYFRNVKKDLKIGLKNWGKTFSGIFKEQFLHFSQGILAIGILIFSPLLILLGLCSLVIRSLYNNYYNYEFAEWVLNGQNGPPPKRNS